MFCAVCQTHVRHYRTTFLRQTSHVQHGTGFTLQVGSHRHNLTDGNYTRAADTGHQYAIRISCRWQRRFWQCIHIQRGTRFQFGFSRFFQFTAFHCHKARAETIDAGKIFITGRLINLTLTSEIRFQRFNRQTVRLYRAVAATFAHSFINHSAFRRIRISRLAVFTDFFAAAAFFRCTGLIVNHRGNTGTFTQLTLHRIQFRAVTYCHAGSPRIRRAVFFRFIRHYDNRVHTFCRNLARNHAGIERPVKLLSTGHRDRIVEQNFISNIHTTGNRCADCQQTRVVIRTIAQITENVFFIGEWRSANPGHTFTAHMSKGRRFTVHPCHHIVTTDTRQRAAAFRHFSGCIVRTARTEMRYTIFIRIRLADIRQCLLFCFQKFHALFHALLNRMTSKIAGNT